MPEQIIVPIVMHLQRDLVLQAIANKFNQLNKEVEASNLNLDKVVKLYKEAVESEKKKVGIMGTMFAAKSSRIIPDVTDETVAEDLEEIYRATLERRSTKVVSPWPWVKPTTRQQYAEDYFHHARVADLGIQFMKNCSYISEVVGAHDPGTYVDIPDVHFRFLLAEYNRLAALQRKQYPTNPVEDNEGKPLGMDAPELLQESKE